MLVTVVTHFPSPYQVELFNAVAASGQVRLQVVYLHAQSPERRWHGTAINHKHFFCEHPASNLQSVDTMLAESALVVFNYYRHPLTRRWIQERYRSGRPWAFWGERLGFQFSPFLGRAYRLVALRWLHACPASIWGIGRRAITSYQLEFGHQRLYENLPYFSDLSRFASNRPRNMAAESIRLLFSGSLIPRKGVDLLARAFCRVAPDEPRLRLIVLGDGPLLPDVKAQLASCASQVDFLGFKDWNDLPGTYAEADVLCAPSRHDGWGLIVPEGLAAGLPVISTTNTGAAEEFIKTEWNGWLIPPDDEDSLHQALLRVAGLQNAELESMRWRARSSVAQHQLENGVARVVAACRSSVRNWKH